MTVHADGPLWLAIDAATYTGTVAVGRGARLLAEEAVAMRGEHEERLMPAVARTLAEAGVTVAMLDRVVCGAGPGSFTSLRIAASIAKGVAASAELPLYAVPSLLLVVAGSPVPLAPATYLVTLDAMRQEAYSARVVVAAGGEVASYQELGIIAAAEITDRAATLGAKALAPDSAPHARGVARLADLLAADGPVERAAWEPRYGRAAEAQVKWEAAHGVPLPRS